MNAPALDLFDHSRPQDEHRARHAAAVDDGKTFSTLAAQFALAGHSLMRAPDGGLFARRFGQVKPLRDLGDAKRFLAQIGAGDRFA